MPDPVVTPDATPAPLVGADGKLAENWRDSLPEEIRGEKSLEVYEDLAGMAKSLVHAQRMTGANTIPLPTENSAQADWDAFYEALGRPKTAQDYAFERDSEVPEELWDKTFVDQLKQTLWDSGATPKVMTAVQQVYNAFLKAIPQAQKKQDEDERSTAEQALRGKWGAAYEDRVHLANLFLDKTANPDQREYIEEHWGNDPVFVEWLAGWGLKTAESHGIDTAQLRKTPGQMKSRREELMGTPGYIDGTLKEKDRYAFDRIQRELDALDAEEMRASPKK